MCNQCLVVNAAQRYDPTRTTVLRDMFAKQMRIRFDKLAKNIVQTIVDQDAFGLEITTNQVARRQFSFGTSDRKMKEFLKWLETQVNLGILTLGQSQQIGKSVVEEWTNLYIYDSYKRGVIRARSEMRNAGMNVPSMDQTGGIGASMGTPFHLERVGLLYIRTFEDLRGITSQMSTQISRVLAQGLADGDNPRVIARKLVRTINGMGKDLGVTDTLGRFIPARQRAEILARTEIIRAHHKGMVQEYRNWGLEGVYVMAEFKTAGDHRVCDVCQQMEGSRYTLDEAENLIPVHPQCRCIILPYEPSR